MKIRITLILSVLSIVLLSGISIYNQEVLTKKLAGEENSFDDYSKMERKLDRVNALGKESPKNKSILWRRHLAYYKTKLDLNEEQRNFLDKMSEFFDENFFITLDSFSKKGISESEFFKTDQGKPSGDLVKQIPNLFNKEQAKQLFQTVGDISTITDWGCGTVSKAKTTKENSGLESARSNGCACLEETSCGTSCPEGTTCKVPNPRCSPTSQGCGCWGVWACSANCISNTELDQQ